MCNHWLEEPPRCQCCSLQAQGTLLTLDKSCTGDFAAFESHGKEGKAVIGNDLPLIQSLIEVLTPALLDLQDV